LGTVIAERTLRGVEHGDSVRVRVGRPRKDRATGDYFCPFSLEGLDERTSREAWGIDSMQALQNALQAIRLALAPHASSLKWEGGQDGWLGFPKAIPDLFGPTFTQRLEGMVDREVERFARTQEAVHRRNRLASGKRTTKTRQ
jgi:hypothetical protein